MKSKLIISLSISVILILSIFILMIYTSDNEPENPNSNDNTIDNITPVISIEIDKYNKTFMINKIEGGADLYWYNVEIINGSATLPEGTIDEGDIIINCTEILDFKWIPTNELFLHCEFVRGEK